MIICNLETILQERRLRISKVSADAKISRTTLAALCKNLGKGIQFDTLNTLCIYLGIKPNQLFTVIPFNISVESVEWMDIANDGELPDHAEIELLYTDRTRNVSIILNCYALNFYSDEGVILDIRVAPLARTPNKNDKNTLEDVELFLSAVRSLPSSALQIIKQKIGEAVASSVKIDGEVPKPFVTFPEQFSALDDFR